MKYLIAICVVAFAAPAAAEQSWRVSMGGGAHYVNDDAIEVITPSRLMADLQLGVDYGLFGDLWIGLAYVGTMMSGETFDDFETDLSGRGARVTVQYRHRLLPWLITSARLGVDAMWFTASVSDTYAYDSSRARLEDEDFAPGLSAAVGADFYLPLVTRRSGSGNELGLGFTVELTYTRLAALEFSDENTRLGAIEPSGIGFNTGVALLF